MADVLLVGAFGQRNPGDEALCEALCRNMSDHRVVVASRDPDQTARDHRVDAIPATAISVARRLRRVDAVVVGGGTVFKSLHPSSGRAATSLLVSTALLVRAARLLGVPVAMIGVGAGALPTHRARRLAGWIARHVDLLVLRDEESAAVLTSAGVAPPFWIAADPAWTLVSTDRPDAASGSEVPRRVTVALSHLASADDTTHDTTHDDGLTAVLARFAAAGWQVRLQPWQPGADEDVAMQIVGRVPTAVIIPAPTDLTRAATDFERDGLVIAMRFHALVTAAAARRRCVAVAHEPKLAGLARRLDQTAVPADASAETLEAACHWALSRPAPTSDAIRREAARAEHGFALLRLLLDGGRTEHLADLPLLELSDGGGRW